MITKARVEKLLNTSLGYTSLRSIPNLARAYQSIDGRHRKTPQTGTTIVAMHYSGGVLMSAESQTTSGRRASYGYTKIELVEPLSLMGICGMIAYAQELFEALRETIGTFENIIETPIYIDGQAQLMVNILRDIFRDPSVFDVIFDLAAIPILAGWDPENNEGRIFGFDEAGGLYETHPSEGYTTTGSGGDDARGLLDEKWEHGLDRTSAIELAVRAHMRAGHRDTGSGSPLLHPLTVLGVSADGYWNLDPESALALPWEIEFERMDSRNDVDRYNFFVAGGAG